MSHVDEGTLHAYLDGALDTLPAAEAERVRGHLAVCDACRARLEEERAVRAEATAILGGATLDVGDLPSFEEVRSLAGGAPRGATPGSRLQRLAWAASVVLALGTGWLLRGGIPQPTGSLDVAAPAAVPVAEQGEALEVDAFAPGADAETRQERAKVAAQDEAATEDVAPPPAARSSQDTRTNEAETVGPPSADDRDALVLSGLAGDRAPADSLQKADLTAPAELWAAARRRREGPTFSTVAQPAADLSDRVAGSGTLRPQAEEARGVVAPAMSAIPGRADAAGPAGGSLVVPGLPVVSVTWLEEPGLVGAVRVLQRMEDGDTLELVHLPAGVQPALLSPVGDGRTQVLAPRDGGWLVARAHASADVLSALLRRLDGGD